MPFFGLFFKKAWIYLLIATFFLLFIYRVYKAGRDKEKLDQLNYELDAVLRRQKIENTVDGLSDSAVLNQLHKHGWIRDENSD